jgi:hypothetical protein
MGNIAVSPLSAAVEAGKMAGYDVYQADGALVKSVRFDKPVSNYMNPVLLSRLASPANHWSLAPLFYCARLGTGTSANPRADESLEAPILDVANWAYHVTATDPHPGGFETQNVNYTYTHCRISPATDPESGVQYNIPRAKWRISHKHPTVPAGFGPVVISEIGWSDSPSNTLSSRIVLPPAQRITLEEEQFLVTIYEIEVRLPDFRTRVFSDIPLDGAFRWANLSTYELGQAVTYNGVIYTSLIDGNTGNVPDSSPDVWERDGAAVLTVSGIYAFRGAFNATDTPQAGILSVQALGALRGAVAESYYVLGEIAPAGGNWEVSSPVGLSKAASILPEGYGWAGRNRDVYPFIDDSHVSFSLTFDITQAASGRLSFTGSAPRDANSSINGIRSIFIANYQFWLDRPICRAIDQSFSLTASVQWHLAQNMD